MVEPFFIIMSVLIVLSLISPFLSGKKLLNYSASAIYTLLLIYLAYVLFKGIGLGKFKELTPGLLSYAVLGVSLIAGALTSLSLNKIGKNSGIAVSLISAGILANFVLSSTLNPFYIIAAWGLLSVSSYGIAAIPKDRVSLGNSLKYAFMGGLSFQLLLLSFVLYYSGSVLGLPIVIGAALLVTAIGFKIGVVPFHMWLPDVYGTSDPIAVSVLSSLMKLGPIALLVNLFNVGLVYLTGYQKVALLTFLMLLAVLTMTWGNVTAAVQRDVQKMLAYSSISHIGFILMAISVIIASYIYGVSAALAYIALIIYLFSYSISKAGAFSYMKGFDNRSYESIKGAGRTYADVSGMFSVSLLNLLGLPPLLGFWAKLFVFMSAANPNIAIFYIGYIPWYALVGIINSVISAFYYVRVLQSLYTESKPNAVFEGLRLTIIVSSAILIIGGIILPTLFI
ncbi:MAG: proton-conducting transporter membrane subunit [Nitrososphaeria archaeon]|jgi:NADH-quinone oxidoreductase subunit N